MKFETYLRTLLSGSEIYIVSGGSGTGGTGSEGPANTIAAGFVTVPAVTWKVALILPVGDNDLSRVDINTRVIAISIPNVQGIRSHEWQDYLTTVEHVEEISGYDFYSNVPTAVQSVIEARLDAGDVQFSAGTYTISEGAGSATITVTRTGSSAGTASVNFATVNGSAGSVPGILPAATLTIINDDAPVLLIEETTDHALAFDSVTQTRDPFSLINPHNLSMDHGTRVSLLVWRLGLLPGDTASAVTVRAEDDQGRVYPLTVEYAGALTGPSDVTQLVVRLPTQSLALREICG